MMHDLECESIRKQFGDFVAVDRVSFKIPSGSFFSILGPSGCGKTTLLRMIAGFEEPSGGDILIKGKSVLNAPPNKRNVKMVFQHLALFPMMNVAENIAYGLRCRGADKAEISSRIKDALVRIGLPDAAEKEIAQLSGGQKQRIAIARCMVLDPDVLLLDEPLGALDLKLREHMKVELKLLQHQFDTTFVYITHDQSEALVMSDYVAVMSGGRFEQVGTPQDLYHNPKTAFVAGFVGDSNCWRGRVEFCNGDAVKIQAESGAILIGVASGNNLAAGMGVEFFVRPEAISISRDLSANAAADCNSLAGEVDGVLFNGANSRALVRLDGEKLIEANLPPSGALLDLKKGERVRLEWPHAESRCFAASDNSAARN